MRVFTMQDRSLAQVVRTDPNMTLRDVFEMTDYTAEEVDAIADLNVGETLLIGSVKDISVERTG